MYGYIEFSNPVRMQFSNPLPTPPPFYRKSLFADNSKVCYKEHNLSYGGIGTMRNSRVKSKRT